MITSSESPEPRHFKWSAPTHPSGTGTRGGDGVGLDASAETSLDSDPP